MGNFIGERASIVVLKQFQSLIFLQVKLWIRNWVYIQYITSKNGVIPPRLRSLSVKYLS